MKYKRKRNAFITSLTIFCVGLLVLGLSTILKVIELLALGLITIGLFLSAITFIIWIASLCDNSLEE